MIFNPMKPEIIQKKTENCCKRFNNCLFAFFFFIKHYVLILLKIPGHFPNQNLVLTFLI